MSVRSVRDRIPIALLTHFLTYCSSRGMRKLNNVNLLMQTDDSTKQAIFDSVCEQRIQAFSSSPTGESTSPDPWADKTAELTFGTEAKPERELNIEEAQAKL